MNRALRRLACWWFGCDPDYARMDWARWGDSVPCKRCDAHDTSYAERAGDTRHNRAREALRYWLFRRWWPERCIYCGGRFAHRDGCDGIPF